MRLTDVFSKIEFTDVNGLRISVMHTRVRSKEVLWPLSDTGYRS
jgi:hypothetical protein